MMFLAGLFMGAGTVVSVLILAACAIWKDLRA